MNEMFIEQIGGRDYSPETTKVQLCIQSSMNQKAMNQKKCSSFLNMTGRKSAVFQTAGGKRNVE